MTEATKNSIKYAAMISAAGRYSKIIISVVVNAILARIVSPEDFGIIAVINVFSTFFYTLSDMGIGAAIVQNQALVKDDIDSIFSSTLYISVLLSVLFGALSIAIASVYKDPIYVKLGSLLMISVFFNSLNMVPNGIMNKKKRFMAIALRTVISYSISAAICLFMAYYGCRYYSLAVQSIISSAIVFFWNYHETKPQFLRHINTKSIKKISNYSFFQFSFNVINYFSRNLDSLLIGKMLGAEMLGFYNKAYTLMLYPVNNLTGVITPVLHPILADYQYDKNKIYIRYLKVFRILLLAGILVEGICLLASDEIISIIYGERWQLSAICFKCLSLGIATQMVTGSAGAIFQALGNTYLLFISSCINTFVTVLFIIYGVIEGKNIETISLCVGLAYIIHFFVAFYLLFKKVFGKKMSTIIKDIWREIVIVLVVVLAVLLYPFNFNSYLLSFFVKTSYISIIATIIAIAFKEYQLLTNKGDHL